MKQKLKLVLTKQNEKPFIIENILYKKENDTIIFCHDNITYRINILKQIFQRENEEFLFEMDFINQKSIYKLKSANVILDIKVENSEFLQKGDSIFMKYMIESDTSEIIIDITFLEGESL